MTIATISARGKSIPEVLADLDQVLDRVIEERLESTEDMHRMHGATDEEVWISIHRTHLECLRAKRAGLAQVRANLLEEQGATKSDDIRPPANDRHPSASTGIC